MGSCFCKKKKHVDLEEDLEEDLEKGIEESIKEETNILKIELYPKKKPRYKFKKFSLKSLVDQNVLGYSFNINDSLAFIYSNNPVINGFYQAHCNHYPIRIKPDHIWLLIFQAFSNHVNANSEKLRRHFVNFDGKQKLIVRTDLSDIKQVDKKELENFSEQINSQIKSFLGEELVETLTPNFTTTDHDSTIVCKISIMAAFKKYFEYEMHLCGCGIPYIILEGTAEDYEKIIEKATKLKKYMFEWYIYGIIPEIQKMVEAKKGNIDINYFKNIVQDDTITKRVGALSGKGGHDVKFPILKGWILRFFAYKNDGKRFDRQSIKVEDFHKLANQMLIVPFKIVDEVHMKEYEMKYSVGFIGCEQNKRKEVIPVTGWIVSPYTKEDKDSIF